MSTPPDPGRRRAQRGRLRPVPDLPDYPEHLGQAVHWEPWEHALHIHCIPQPPCEECNSTARPYYTVGVVHPRPGQTFEGEQTRYSTRHPGRAWKRTQAVPAWPIRRLCAFACADCGTLRLYDQGEDGRDFLPVDPGQPTLF